MKLIRNIASKARALKARFEAKGPPDVVEGMKQTILSFVPSTKQTLEDLRQAVLRAYRRMASSWDGRPHEDENPPTDFPWTSISLKTSAALVTALEAFCAGFLGALTLNLKPAGAASVGVGVSITIGLAAKSVYSVCVHAPDQPRLVLGRVRKHLLVLFPVWLAGLIGTLLVDRIVTHSSHLLTNLVVLGLSLLTVVSPFLAAALFEMGSLLGWAYPFVRQLREIDSTIEVVDDLAAAVGTPIAPPTAIAPVPRRDGAAATAAAVLLALAFAHNSHAAQPCPYEVFVDRSQSVSSPDGQPSLQIRAALTRLPELLREHAAVSSGAAECVEIIAFAGDALWATPIARFDPPQQPATQCAATPATDTIIFKAAAEDEATRARQQCEYLTSRASADRQAKVESSISNIVTRVARAAAAESTRSCYFDLVERIAANTNLRHALIIGDGVESNCGRASASRPATVPAADVITLAIFPPTSSAASAGVHFQQFKSRWAVIAPTVGVIQPVQIENTWSRK